MATVVRTLMNATGLRHALGRSVQCSVRFPGVRPAPQQRRWAQVHDVRFLATTQVSRNITEKYREKLDRKAKQEGHEDIDSLKEAYADEIADLKKKDSDSVPGLDALLADETAPPIQGQTPPPPPPDNTAPSSGMQQPPPPPPRAEGSSASSTEKSPIKPLSSILDLDKARDLPLKELSAIWRLRHAALPNSLCAVIPTAQYLAQTETARANPAFVLPVPREGQGAEIHFLQWVFDAESRTATVLFTQLAEFKARGEWAQPHTSVTHYWDAGMADPKGPQGGAVLMAGSVVDGRGASVQDAQWLVMLLQRFYGAEGAAGDGGKRRLVEDFAKGVDGGFSVEKLLEESEKL